ncbi:MAG: LPS export ABC transporter permease LptF [Gammaproteobacteria bacterium]|nr:LPS export ABC transporter permease LptF [Gammaproteobacteria bacterium]
MKIVTRYLMREIYSSMLASVVVLLFIFLSNLFVRFMHSAAGGVLSGSALKILMLLQVPILSAILLPAGLFLGILFAYGRLYADSEMTVFAVCGMNPRRLLTTNVALAFVVMILVAFLSLWLNPKVYKYSDHIRSGATSNVLDMVKASHFNELFQGKWIFYVEGVSADNKKFYNVFAAEQPDAQHQPTDPGLRLITAKQAYQKVDPDTGDLYLVLLDGHRYIGNPGEKDYEIIKYGEYGLQIPQEDKVWHGDESSVPTMKLWHDRHDKLSAAELQWRISLPLSALILTLLATPLSRVKPRRGRYARLGPAVLLYIIYANFLFLARAWIKRGVLLPMLGMWWVHGLMLILAIFLIGQQIGWWRIFGIKSNDS